MGSRFALRAGVACVYKIGCKCGALGDNMPERCIPECTDASMSFGMASVIKMYMLPGTRCIHVHFERFGFAAGMICL